jgi:hypothetical protein
VRSGALGEDDGVVTCHDVLDGTLHNSPHFYYPSPLILWTEVNAD